MWTSQVALAVKNPPVGSDASLGREDPREGGMATHSWFLLGESRGQRSLAGFNPWGHTCQT